MVLHNIPRLAFQRLEDGNDCAFEVVVVAVHLSTLSPILNLGILGVMLDVVMVW